jgi:hypothetical protein
MSTITNNDITRRIARLEKLGRDLAEEAAVFEENNDPLYHDERRNYVSAILDAVGGLAAARDLLAFVRSRLDQAEVPVG